MANETCTPLLYLWGLSDLAEHGIEDLQIVESIEPDVDKQEYGVNADLVCNLGEDFAPVLEHTGGCGPRWGREMVAATNAVRKLAARLQCDPVALAERLDLVALFNAMQRIVHPIDDVVTNADMHDAVEALAALKEPRT